MEHNRERKSYCRRQPCDGCPFLLGVPQEAKEPGNPIPMLCHESGCLEGIGPDLICEGWLRHEQVSKAR